MKLRFSFLGLLSLLAVSCSYEESFVSEDNNDNSTVEFYATIDEQPDAATKVYADDQLRVLWNEDDRITIFSKFTYNQEYWFLGEDGDNAGAFRKVPNDDYVTGNDLPKSYAIYPYLESTKISNDGMITFTLPSEQIYHPDSFGIGANTMVSASETNELRFKNVGGYLSLKFYGEGVSISSITLKGNNGELLAGKCSIDMSSGLPVLTMDEGKATDTISLVCDPAVDLGNSSSDAIAFWFVLPPVTFTKGITVTVNTQDGGVFEKSTSNKLEIGRSAITKLGALEVVPKYIGNIDFADEDFKAYCVENFDQDNDGEISYDEALDVEAINVYTDEIESIEEIRYFKNLTKLCVRGSAAAYKYKSGEASGYSDIGDLPDYTGIEEGTSIATGSLTSIDLRGLNRLQELDVTGNNMITIQNIEDCVQLTSLGCAFCNLSSLELTNNTALESLLCFANQLTSLDVSKNTALKELSCGANPLTSLDVSNNTFLLNLYCGESMLTSLSVNNNTALIDLDCSNNQLSSLDVSSNAEINYLNCSSNQLSSLDLSNNIALRYLFSDSNQLSSLNVCNCTDLQELTCSSNQLRRLDVSDNTMLKMLDCNCNPNLSEIWLKANQSIEYLRYDTDVATIKYKPEAVDLGLPSGLKWASLNIGASNPEGYGEYFAFGEVELKSEYSWSNYIWCNGSSTNLTKYNFFSEYGIIDNKSVLEAKDDAAHVKYGSKWRLPTDAEWAELRESCTWTWAIQNEVDGYLITGTNGNSIFLPAAGRRSGANLDFDGVHGNYWSSTLPKANPGNAQSLWFGSGGVHHYDFAYYFGFPIRPVLGDLIHPDSVTLNRKTLLLSKGAFEKLIATVSPENAAIKDVFWSSNDESVAFVSSTGEVTAIASGTAIITVTTGDGAKTATCSVTVQSEFVVPDAVDMGLSVKWASFNIGASMPEGFGAYYAWGETESRPYSDYSWSSYLWCNGSENDLTKYNTNNDYGIVDNKTVLEAEDDIARVKFGEHWRIPTDAEWTELRENCTWKWTSQSGINGYKVTATNGNSIFLPAAGYCFGSFYDDAGSYGGYWSSSLNATHPYNVLGVAIHESDVIGEEFSRYYGLSIRPVSD